MDTEQLNFIREELYQLFVDLKKSKGLKKSNYQLPRTERITEKFKEAAKLCIQLNALPEDFINAQAAYVDVDHLRIDDLSTDRAKKNYEAFLGSRQLPIDRLYNVQMMYLKSQIVNAKRTVERALMDDDLHFQPWFRCCITREVVPEVMEKYGSEAKEQIKSPVLVKFLEERNLDYSRLK